MSNLIEIGALWKRKDGKPGLVGELGRRARLIVQKNDNKRAGSKDPDYYLLLAPAEPKAAPPREPGDDSEVLP